MGEPSTDRLGLLLDQLDRARELAQARLEGLASPPSLPTGTPLGPRRGSGRLSDEEYLWEPASGAWSIRRRDQAATPRAFGPGEWVLDNDTGDPDPAPVTTIAWRLGHLHSSFAGRFEWTFGERRQPPALLVDCTPSAAVALERFWSLMDRWRDSVAAMTPEQLEVPGFGQYPNGSDPRSPSSPSSGGRTSSSSTTWPRSPSSATCGGLAPAARNSSTSRRAPGAGYGPGGRRMEGDDHGATGTVHRR